MAESRCSHKHLKKQNSGGLSWYVCANPDCDAPKVKGNPQKFKAESWDGQVREVSPAGTGQPTDTPALDKFMETMDKMIDEVAATVPHDEFMRRMDKVDAIFDRVEKRRRDSVKGEGR